MLSVQIAGYDYGKKLDYSPVTLTELKDRCTLISSHLNKRCSKLALIVARLR